jgi:N-acetyl-alpha-D-glucosaminyl L-malate synthase BshA
MTKRRAKYASPDQKILIHMSNFRPVKQVLNTIRVFEKIQKEIPSVLLMVGDGQQWCEANKLAIQLGIQDSVKFLGTINAIEHILPIADMFIINSVKESFGLAVLEAAACGVPALVTDAGGLPEVVEEGKTGLIAPMEDVDKMAQLGIELLSDESRLNQMKTNARKRAVELFDNNIIVPQYEAYYEKVLK